MSKIKYENKIIRQEILYHTKNVIEDLEKTILAVISYYDILKPMIIDYEIGYDRISIILISNNLETKKYTISFDFDMPVFVDVKQNNDDYYDTFHISQNKIFLSERSFRNSETKTRLIKIYETDDRLLVKTNLYHEYEYYYQNDILDSEIYLKIPKTKIFQEDLFVKRILKNSNIKNINDIYREFANFFSIQDINIIIINKTQDGYNEKMIINNGQLKEYQRCIKTNNSEIEFLNYDGKELWITKKEDIFTNECLNEIKKLIK